MILPAMILAKSVMTSIHFSKPFQEYSMSADYGYMHEFLMRHMHLMHNPVGMTFIFTEEKRQKMVEQHEFHAPVKQLTLCQAELGARMEGLNILLPEKNLWCRTARVGFRLLEHGDLDRKSHKKFCESEEQVEYFIASKPRLPRAPLAIAMLPLSNCLQQPDIVHFCCDNMQAYHLINDWMAVTGTHPFRPYMCINSSLCGGSAYAFANQTANLTLACAGSYNSGKMERGEINVFIPGVHVDALFARLENRVKTLGGASLTRLGDPFPGVEVCQNCPVIIFKKLENNR